MKLTMIGVTSSNVARIGFANSNLYVEFKNGSLYKYAKVPEEKFTNMMKAESKGKFLNKEIKGYFECWRVK